MGCRVGGLVRAGRRDGRRRADQAQPLVLLVTVLINVVLAAEVGNIVDVGTPLSPTAWL